MFNTITLQLGQEIMLAVKAEMGETDGQRMIAQINTVEERVHERFPAVRWMFFEPDVAD